MPFESRPQLSDRLPSDEFLKLESLEAQKYFAFMSNVLENKVSQKISRSPEKMLLIKQLKEEAELFRQELEEIKNRAR